MNKFKYTLYGLKIESDIELPELDPVDFKAPEVYIRIGSVPEHLDNPRGAGVLYEAAKNDFLLKLETVSGYRVQQGKEITIDPVEGVSPEEVRLFLLGSAMGALLHQRGMLAIHGSTISKNKCATLITGFSSAGKSSLAAGMIEKGYSIISDDISVIGKNHNNDHFIYKGMPHLKLWKDVLLHLNENVTFEKVRPKVEKYKRPVKWHDSEDQAKLSCIILLSIKNTPGFTIEELKGSRKFDLIRTHTYRIQYIEKLDQSLVHFKRLTEIAKSVRVFKIERPQTPLLIRELSEFVSINIETQIC